MSVQVKQVARDLLARLEVVEAESASIRADLNVLLDGQVEPPPARTPNGQRTKRSKKGDLVGRQLGAAKARARKQVGSGRGKVGSRATQSKLNREVKK